MLLYQMKEKKDSERDMMRERGRGREWITSEVMRD